jgi:nitrile hydratase accessory protein
LSPPDAHSGAEPLPAAALALPRDAADAPVFNEPWEAQAFAMAVSLHRSGCFTWGEWAAALGAQIARPDRRDAGYYEHWLAALETLVTEKRVLDTESLEARREAWRRAAAATPHGQPILLENAS